MVRTRSRLLWLPVLTILLFPGCRLYNYLLGSWSAQFGNLGPALVAVDLSDPALEFDICQSHLQEGDLEYAVGVKIDTDDDASTGDANGYDVDFSVRAVMPPPADAYATTVALTDIIAFGAAGIGDSGFIMTPQFPAEEVESQDRQLLIDGTTVYFETSLLTEEYLQSLSTTCRLLFYATYNSPPDRLTFETDEVEVLVGSGTKDDPEGDVSFAYIDIVSVRFEAP